MGNQIDVPIRATSDNAPVLFMMFNRPDLAAIVFSEIRKVKPKKLFIAADGPRQDRAGEEELCRLSRELVSMVDWPCEVRTLFRDRNYGCCTAVSEAITWFFQHVDRGIILEDDCVPDKSFFPYCAELLEMYRDDNRIMVVSGDNRQHGMSRTSKSYYFSKYPNCWGWATWKRAWDLCDIRMKEWPVVRDSRKYRGMFHCAREANYWIKIFDQCYEGKIDSWAYPWTYSCWMAQGLTIIPDVNLVDNIGFDARATHTVNSGTRAGVVSPATSIEFPLIHQRVIRRNTQADRYHDHVLLSGARLPVSQYLLKIRWLIWARIRELYRQAIM